MAMLAPVHVENFGRLFGSNQPISAHFTAFISSDQLQWKRSSIFQEALREHRHRQRSEALVFGAELGPPLDGRGSWIRLVA
jgi:hypothetical protein